MRRISKFTCRSGFAATNNELHIIPGRGRAAPTKARTYARETT